MKKLFLLFMLCGFSASAQFKIQIQSVNIGNPIQGRANAIDADVFIDLNLDTAIAQCQMINDSSNVSIDSPVARFTVGVKWNNESKSQLKAKIRDAILSKGVPPYILR